MHSKINARNTENEIGASARRRRHPQDASQLAVRTQPPHMLYRKVDRRPSGGVLRTGAGREDEERQMCTSDMRVPNQRPLQNKRPRKQCRVRIGQRVPSKLKTAAASGALLLVTRN